MIEEFVTFTCTDCQRPGQGPPLEAPRGWSWYWVEFSALSGGAYVYCPNCSGPANGELEDGWVNWSPS